MDPDMDPMFEVVAIEPNELRLVGEFDMTGVSTFEDALMGRIPANGQLTLDLSELSFIDSSGVRALVACAQSLNGGGPLVLANPTEHVARVLDILGLARSRGFEIKVS